MSESQSGFVLGRNITNELITANETIHWLKKHKIPRTLFKIDFRKVYDSVSWIFVKQANGLWTKYGVMVNGMCNLSFLIFIGEWCPFGAF